MPFMADSPSLGGAFFPVQGLTPWLSVLARVNPTTYAIDLLRQVPFHLQGKESVFLLPLVLFGHRLTTAAELPAAHTWFLTTIVVGGYWLDLLSVKRDQ